MALNIKNAEVEALAAAVAAITGESKTEAIRRALEERKARLAFQVASGSRESRLRGYLERELWPAVPEEQLGRRLSPEEEESILGYGESGA